jgi:hypothetical protein
MFPRALAEGDLSRGKKVGERETFSQVLRRSFLLA